MFRLLAEFVYLVYAHYRYEFFCPKCGKRFSMTMSLFLLGPGWRRCKKCGEVVRDGSREWDELQRWEKLDYVLPSSMRHYLIVLVLISAIIMIASDSWRNALPTVGWMIVTSIIIWLPVLLLKSRRVRESRERFALHGASVNRDWTAGM
jgi:hypothetical protein